MTPRDAKRADGKTDRSRWQSSFSAFLSSTSQLSVGWRYATAPVATALAYLVQAGLLPKGSIAPFVFFFVAVAVSALVGGSIPGLLAVVLSAAVANHAFLGGQGWSTSVPELTATAMFAVASSVVALLCAAFRDSVSRAHQAALGFQRQAQELARAQEAAAADRTRLALALQAARCGTFDWDAKSNVNRWSDELLELYGLGRDQFGGRSEDWLAALVPEDRELGRAALKRSFETGLFECEFRVRRRDTDEIRWMYGRGEVFFNDRHEPMRMVGLNVDITERKRADEVARKAVDRYEREARLFDAVASTTPDFVYIFDRQGHFQYANRRLLEVWGLQLTDVLDKSPRELGYEQWHHDMHMREIAQVIESKRPIKGEVPFRAPLTGVFGIYEYIFTPVLGPDGEVELIAGTTRDVTERKRAEEALRMEEQRLRAIFENVALGIGEVDPQGRVENVNQRLCQLLGYRRDELLGMSLYDLTAPEDRQRSSELNGKLNRGELDSFHYEKRYLRKGGEPVWVHVTVSAIRNARGDVVRAVGTIEDISERRRADQALNDALKEAEESRRLLEAMMEHIPLGITIAETPDVSIRQVSRYGRELIAKRSEELTGIPAQSHPDVWQVFRADGVTPATADELPLTRATVKGELVRGEEWVVGRKDGVRIPILCTAAPIRDRSGNITGGVIGWQDISERKRSEEELQKANKRLLEADQQKNDFLAVLSHELRNPLAPIRNSIYILERTTPGGEQSRRALSVIDRQVMQLKRLIDDLLDVTRISRGKIRLQRESLELNEVIRGTADDFHDLFRRNGIGFEVQVPDRRLRARADRTRIAQIIGNLLQNAAKFTPSGGRVRLALDQDDSGRAVISVRDTGAGIEPRVIERLFAPFVQADATLDRSKGGLGLGLALVKGLVELHGGSVSARSEGPGRGAEFTVRLPLEEVKNPVAHAREPQRESEYQKALRVLLIEDNLDAAESLREALLLNGHDVETAATGLQGIEKAHAFHPDVVLCDIGLPEIDGYEVARRMRADPLFETTSLIALSGYAAPEDLEKSKEAGFARHLAKPPDLDELEATMLEACAPARRGDATPHKQGLPRV